MRHTTQYLYNIEPSQLTHMLYANAIRFKILSAKVLIVKLLEPHYSIRDDERINAVHKAISFNIQLLKELEC